MKKILMYFTAAMLTLAAPTAAQAATGTMDIGGAVNNNLAGNIVGVGFTWTASTNTLKLTSVYTRQKIHIKCAATDVINLEYTGEVMVFATENGIHCLGSLNLTGSGGQLWVASDTEGIRAERALTFSDGNFRVEGGHPFAGIRSANSDVTIGGAAYVDASGYQGIVAKGYLNIHTSGSVNAFATGTYASDAISAGNVTISQGTVTSGGNYAGGSVRGIFVISGSSGVSLTVNGNLNGSDQQVSGGQLTVTGRVAGNLTVKSGGTATLSGAVGGNLVVRDSGTVTTVDGSVEGNLMVTGGTVTVKGSVGGTTTHTGGTLNGKQAFEPVTNITGIQASVTASAGEGNLLHGTVVPATATNKSIVWSVHDAGTTGAAIFGTNGFTAYVAGTAIIRATIADGLAVGTPYTQDFAITVNPAPGECITPAALTGVVAPVAGASPSTAINDGTGFSASLVWDGNPVVFDYETAHTATVTLLAETGYTFSCGFANTAQIAGFTVNGIVPVWVENSGSWLKFKVTFPATRTAPPIPMFLGLADEYTAGSHAVMWKVTGAGSSALTTFKVNGKLALWFNPSEAGTYLVEASSDDGKLRIWKYVKVK